MFDKNQDIYKRACLSCKDYHFGLYIFFFCLFFHSRFCFSQQIERKMIIDKNGCYYTTIDPEFQIATLYNVELNRPLKSAKKMALPAGRNFNLPVIPFCWDLVGNDVFAINFINNAMSNRKQAIKRIPISSLKEWKENISISDVVQASAEYRPYTTFEPYRYLTEQSTTLDHFFFDAVEISDSVFCFAISNNGKLTIWEYNKDSWSKGEEISMQIDDFFSLVTYKSRPYLILSDGSVYAIKNNKLMKQLERKINTQLSRAILIIDKRNDKIWFMNAATFDETKSMEELIKKNAIAIF